MTSDYQIIDRRGEAKEEKPNAEIPQPKRVPEVMYDFAPLFDRILVLEDTEARKIGDLYIPETAREEMRSGTCIAVGPGARSDAGHLMEMSVKPKDRILFGKYAGSEIRISGVLYLIMREPEVFGTVVKRE
jgi:chaperonin GroES